MAAVRYVEKNPVRSGIVAISSDYKWSSARTRCGLAFDSLLDPTWPPPGLIPNWPAWLNEGSARLSEQTIRKNTSTGRPCGTDSFVGKYRTTNAAEFSAQKSRPNNEDPIEPKRYLAVA